MPHHNSVRCWFVVASAYGFLSHNEIFLHDVECVGL